MDLNEALAKVERKYVCITAEWLKEHKGLEQQMIDSKKPINTLWNAAKLMGFEGSANPFRAHMTGNCQCHRLTKH